MTREVSLLFLNVALLLSACAAPTAPAALTPSSTWTPTPTTPIPQPTATRRPSLTPTPTRTKTPRPLPTLPGPGITRTSAPKAQCPRPSYPPATITFGKSAEEVGPQILKYLNTYGSGAGLQAALTGLTLTVNNRPLPVEPQVISQDVTGDQTPDEIVELLYPYSFLPNAKQGDLFVFVCKWGAYELALHRGQYEVEHYEGLLAITDMNGDGVPEIVYSHRLFLPSDIQPRVFHIQEWNGTEFEYLTFPPAYPNIGGGAGVITDTDANGTLELNVLGDLWSPNYGSDHGFHQIWAWSGKFFYLYDSYYDPLIWRYEAIQNGDQASKASYYASYNGGPVLKDRYYEIALEFYQRAISDDSLFAWGEAQDPLNPQPGLGDPDEWPRLSAYAHYRLMLLHTSYGSVSKAQIVYEALQNQFPPGTVGHEYAELAAFFWDEYSSKQDLKAACDAVIARAAYHKEFSVPFAKQIFGDNEVPESHICPFYNEPFF